MTKTIYEFSNGRGDIIVKLMSDTLGDFLIRVHRADLDEILELSDQQNSTVFNCFFHLIRLHREVEREYFMISDNTAPIDRDQMVKDDLEALADRMENIIEAICALC